MTSEFSSIQLQCYDERKPSPGDPVPAPGGVEHTSAGQWVLVINAMLAHTHCSCGISLSLRTLSSPLHLFWDFCQVHYTGDSLADLKTGSPVSLVAILLQLWQIKQTLTLLSYKPPHLFTRIKISSLSKSEKTPNIKKKKKEPHIMFWRI